MKTINRCLLFTMLWTSVVFSFGWGLEWGIRARSTGTLEQELKQARDGVKENPGQVTRLNRLALLLMQSGNYEEANDILNQSLGLAPQGIEARLIRAELLKRQYRLKESESEINAAAALEPGNRRVRLMKAGLAARKNDFDAATSIYRSVLEKTPGHIDADINALAGLAALWYKQNRLTESESYIKKILDLDPDHPGIHLLYARLFRQQRKTREYKDQIREAMKYGAANAEIRAAFGEMLIKSKGNLKDGVAHLKAALKLDPYCRGANLLLGWGYRLKDYSMYAGVMELKRSSPVYGSAKQANEFLSKGKYNDAVLSFSKALDKNPAYIPAYTGKATAYYHLGNHHESIKWYFKALDRAPSYGLAYYGIHMNCRALEENFCIGRQEIELAFNRLDAPEPEFLRNVFINYHECHPDLQKIIRLTVAPVSRFLKPMKTAGATVYFMDMHQFLWQCPFLQFTKGTRTFDMRLWDDVKGQGGYHLASHKEEALRTKYRKFNIFAHEFGHLVHHCLSPAQRKQVRKMYLKAKKEGRIFDWYSDLNDWEYFAQGFEAYVSPVKAPDQKGTAGHTRAELKEKDPALFEFIDRLNRLPDYRENMIMAYLLKAKHGAPGVDAKVNAMQEGMAKHGSHPVLLNGLGNLYQALGDFKKAETYHRRSITEFPNNPEGYVQLANDYARVKKDPAKAVRVLERYSAVNKHSALYYFRLGELYMETGQWDKMETALRRGIKLDPVPNVFVMETREPHFLLARACMRRKAFKEAEKLLLYSLNQINRNNAEAWAALALVYLKTKRVEKAKHYLKQAVALNPKAPLVKKARQETGQ